MMIENHFEGIEVDLESVINHIAHKLHSDIEHLKYLFSHTEGIQNFKEQTRLLKEIQAGVRATHILDSKVDSNANTFQPAASTQPQQAEQVDLKALEVTLAGAGAAVDGSSAPVNGRTNGPALANAKSKAA